MARPCSSGTLTQQVLSTPTNSNAEDSSRNVIYVAGKNGSKYIQRTAKVRMERGKEKTVYRRSKRLKSNQPLTKSTIHQDIDGSPGGKRGRRSRGRIVQRE